MTLSAQHLFLIPALPLLAAAIGALLPRHQPRLAATTAIAGISASFACSVIALIVVLRDPTIRHTFNFAWFDLGAEPLRLGLLLDPLTAFMCVMVTFVSTLIFIFSLGYMKHDANVTRFFCFLSLFAAAMLGIVVSNSLLLLFISWELVGLASYLLIGFWFHKPSAAAAAKKAFITTRIGDLGFLLGLVWLYHATGSLLLFDHGAGAMEPAALNALSTQQLACGLGVSAGIGLLLFCGAIGKSGQFPLHVWLPDAMEGPTPVSALIHAATMVAAGVFLMARIYPLMTADQLLADAPFHAMTVVAFIGAITALLGACLAVAQNDLKRVLAFSTVSQLGYMMLAIGVGSWVAAIFHLLTHAFFKALLFLGAGSVIHAAHHEQDIRRLGGLAPKMKLTFATFAIGTMALAGVPFLFSGFWSKEAIIHAAHAWPVSHLPFVIALVAVALTAFYMTRLVAEVFFGQSRSPAAEHAHENSATMTVPLVLLAAAAILLGFLGTPAWPWLQTQLLAPLTHQATVLIDPHLPGPWHALIETPALLFLSIVLVGAGISLGWWIYGRKTRATADALDPLEAAAPRAFTALANRLGFDELYAATVGRLVSALAILADLFDRYIWDGAVRATAAFARVFGLMNQQADDAVLNAGFDAASEKLRASGRAYSRAQTGHAHGYLLTLALAFVALAIALMIGGAR
ncbi:MAG TPA: NADH-quinone oxidoreductase subunit L [Opitutus sp.]|nr:NADH-quinone oxidoreductase subunit L [Opitutus sp.]